MKFGLVIVWIKYHEICFVAIRNSEERDSTVAFNFY